MTGREWLSCERLVADPDHLAATVATTKAARRIERDDLAMSYFVIGYATRVATAAVGAWMRNGEVLDVAPANTSIALDGPKPRWLDVHEVRIARPPDPAQALHRELVDGHLALLVECARRACRVGKALLWGNVGAACAYALGRDIARAPDLFAAARPEVARSGRLVAVGATVAWHRKSCCLWYQAPCGSHCDDCSMRAEPVSSSMTRQ